MSEETVNQNSDNNSIIEMTMKFIENETANRLEAYRERVAVNLYELRNEIGDYARSVLDKGKPLDLNTIFEIQEMVGEIAVKIDRNQL